jgi:transposase
MWCVAKLNEEYITRMEDVIETYEKPLSYKEPVICLDEKPIQLLKNICSTSRMVKLGEPRKKDYEYIRKGTACAFCVIEPKRGKHLIEVSKTRKAADFAAVMRKISRSYPNAEKIHIVMDNLNTHRQDSLIRFLGPKRGLQLWKRFEVHYTPKHASWLNQAETQISMYARECLGSDRIATLTTLEKRSKAWEARSNVEKRKIRWGFTRDKARAKFGYSIPQIQ